MIIFLLFIYIEYYLSNLKKFLSILFLYFYYRIF